MDVNIFQEEKNFWLKNSDFYNCINLDEEGTIDIPYCSIYEKDINKIFLIINQWGVNFIPHQILETIFTHDRNETIQILKKYYKMTHSKFYKFLIIIFVENMNYPLELAIEKKFLDLSIYFNSKSGKSDYYFLEIVSLYGNLKFMKYLHENGFIWDKETCNRAAQCGHLNCLEYAHENGCPWDSETMDIASENGHLNCIKATCVSGT